MKISRWSLVSLCSVLIALNVAGCASGIKTIKLSVTPQHRSYLPTITKDTYSYEELEPVFARLGENSDQLCLMLYGLETYNDERVTAIAGSLNLKRKRREL